MQRKVEQCLSFDRFDQMKNYICTYTLDYIRSSLDRLKMKDCVQQEIPHLLYDLSVTRLYSAMRDFHMVSCSHGRTSEMKSLASYSDPRPRGGSPLSAPRPTPTGLTVVTISQAIGTRRLLQVSCPTVSRSCSLVQDLANWSN